MLLTNFLVFMYRDNEFDDFWFLTPSCCWWTLFLLTLPTTVTSCGGGPGTAGADIKLPKGGYATSPQGYRQAVFESLERTSGVPAKKTLNMQPRWKCMQMDMWKTCGKQTEFLEKKTRTKQSARLKKNRYHIIIDSSITPAFYNHLPPGNQNTAFPLRDIYAFTFQNTHATQTRKAFQSDIGNKISDSYNTK